MEAATEPRLASSTYIRMSTQSATFLAVHASSQGPSSHMAMDYYGSLMMRLAGSVELSVQFRVRILNAITAQRGTHHLHLRICKAIPMGHRVSANWGYTAWHDPVLRDPSMCTPSSGPLLEGPGGATQTVYNLQGLIVLCA